MNCSICLNIRGLDEYNPRHYKYPSFRSQLQPCPDDLDLDLNLFEFGEILGDGFLSDQDAIRLQHLVSSKFFWFSLNVLGQSMARLQQNKANGELIISTCLAELDNSTGLPR